MQQLLQLAEKDRCSQNVFATMPRVDGGGGAVALLLGDSRKSRLNCCTIVPESRRKSQSRKCSLKSRNRIVRDTAERPWSRTELLAPFCCWPLFVVSWVNKYERVCSSSCNSLRSTDAVKTFSRPCLERWLWHSSQATAE